MLWHVRDQNILGPGSRHRGGVARDAVDGDAMGGLEARLPAATRAAMVRDRAWRADLCSGRVFSGGGTPSTPMRHRFLSRGLTSPHRAASLLLRSRPPCRSGVRAKPASPPPMARPVGQIVRRSAPPASPRQTGSYSASWIATICGMMARNTSSALHRPDRARALGWWCLRS